MLITIFSLRFCQITHGIHGYHRIMTPLAMPSEYTTHHHMDHGVRRTNWSAREHQMGLDEMHSRLNLNALSTHRCNWDAHWMCVCLRSACSRAHTNTPKRYRPCSVYTKISFDNSISLVGIIGAGITGWAGERARTLGRSRPNTIVYRSA